MKSPFWFASDTSLCKSCCKISNYSLRSTPSAPDRVKLFPLLKLKQWIEGSNVNSSYLEQVINTQVQKKNSERKFSSLFYFLTFIKFSGMNISEMSSTCSSKYPKQTWRAETLANALVTLCRRAGSYSRYAGHPAGFSCLVQIVLGITQGTLPMPSPHIGQLWLRDLIVWKLIISI